MKKILQIIILISFSLNGLHAKKFGQCNTQEEALNMMIASQVHGSKLMQDYENALRLSSTAMDIYNQKTSKNSKDYENVELLLKKAQKAEQLLKSYRMDSMFYSRLLVNKKYQETCDRFIVLAKQYNFDIKKDSKTTLKVDTHKNESTCKGEDAAGVLLFLLKDPEVSKNPKISNQLNVLGLDMIQNPDLACKKLKKLVPSVGQSYETLLVRAKKRMSAVKKIVDTSNEIRKENEKNNKTVTRNMAKDLFFKRKDFSDKISEVKELWFTLYRTASKATIRNKKLIKFVTIQSF